MYAHFISVESGNMASNLQSNLLFSSIRDADTPPPHTELT